ncbi:MAG: hypothetical protein ACYTFG_21040 [Planctomycetota bacterium]
MGDTWTAYGDLLNLYKCDKIKAHFTLKEILIRHGEKLAKITGTMSGWPAGRATKMKFKCELLFSLDRKRPVSGKLEYDVAPYQSRDSRRVMKIRFDVVGK